MHVRWRTASAASLVYLSDAAYCAARSYVDKTRRAVARSASGRRVFLTRSPHIAASGCAEQVLIMYTVLHVVMVAISTNSMLAHR